MTHDISTGQKYLPKNYLFQALMVQFSLLSFNLIFGKILEKHPSRNSSFMLETYIFIKTEPF